VFDNQDHSFYLHAAQVNLERLATKDMIVGYHLELVAGHDVSIYEQGVDTSNEPTNIGIGLQEAWIQILAPIGNGLDIRIGKMASLIGYEVLENTNNLNYSRGVVWGPDRAHHGDGRPGDLQLREQVSLTIGFNNGRNAAATAAIGVPADMFSDLDHGKMFEAQLMVKPIKDFWVAMNFNVGNETNGGRAVEPAAARATSSTSSTSSRVQAGQADAGPELRPGVEPGRVHRADVGSRSAARPGGLRQVPADRHVRHGRARRVLQRHERRRPSHTGNGDGARVISLTLTEELTVAKNMILRLEFRHDSSNQRIFNRAESGPNGCQGRQHARG
jgi:hypothetical protein